MAWGAAHGWDAPSFRVYYLAGALLSAPLLGLGSLSLAGRRWAGPLGRTWGRSQALSAAGVRPNGTVTPRGTTSTELRATSIR